MWLSGLLYPLLLPRLTSTNRSTRELTTFGKFIPIELTGVRIRIVFNSLGLGGTY